MATYKVIQDIEAEDKILGPLTLRQFGYSGIAAVCLYLTYFTATHHALFMAAFFVPVAVVSGFFGFPWGRDQPTEIWALARVRFLFKPRRRIWDQDGTKDLVTVTAPKKEVVDYTNGLSQTEVKSRLRALADTIDSRGWAIKNANLNSFSQPPLIMNEPGSSDRLIDFNDFPQQVSNLDIRASDDMLDEQNNPIAQHVDSMINASAEAHRKKIEESLNRPDTPLPPPAKTPATPAPQPANYWFLNQPAQPARIPDDMVTFNTQVVTPQAPVGQALGPSAPLAAPISPSDEKALVQELDERKRELPMTAYYGHLHTIQPLSAQTARPPQQPQPQVAIAAPVAAANPVPQSAPVVPAQPQNTGFAAVQPSVPAAVPTQQQPVTPAQQAAILQLANNDDLNVATLAREAKARTLQDEVVIKLH